MKISFRKSMAKKILEGYKKTTIRLNINFSEGDILDVYSNGIKICKIKITKIEKKKIKDLTKKDIINEGFYSYEALINYLKKIYGNKINKDKEIYIVHFEVI